MTHPAPPDPARFAPVADAAGHDAGTDPALLGDFLERVAAAASSQGRLKRADLAVLGDLGRRAAELGVAPRAVVDLYLSAAWRWWAQGDVIGPGPSAGVGVTQPPDPTAGQVHAAALAVLRAVDDGVAAVMEGFQLARADLIRLAETARHDVVDALLDGGRRAVGTAAAAADLGLNVTGPVGVIVVRGTSRFGDPSTAGLPGRVERALQGRLADSHPLVVLRDGTLVCVFAAPDDAAVRQVCDRLAGAVTGHLGPGTWQAAVSRRRIGASSVRASHVEAVEALDLARRAGIGQPVVDAAELAIYRVLLRDRQAADDLLASTLTPLRAARGGAGPLLETLRVYFSCGGVATATAARLHLSVRAVTYRLHRVAQLLGRDPTDPAHRLTLEAAVTVAWLLGWPDGADAAPAMDR